MVTESQLFKVSHDVGSQQKILGCSRSLGEEQNLIHILDDEHKAIPEKAFLLLLMWLQSMEKDATVGLLVDCLRKIELGGVAEKLLGWQVMK